MMAKVYHEDPYIKYRNLHDVMDAANEFVDQWNHDRLGVGVTTHPHLDKDPIDVVLERILRACGKKVRKVVHFTSPAAAETAHVMLPEAKRHPSVRLPIKPISNAHQILRRFLDDKITDYTMSTAQIISRVSEGTNRGSAARAMMLAVRSAIGSGEFFTTGYRPFESIAAQTLRKNGVAISGNARERRYSGFGTHLIEWTDFSMVAFAMHLGLGLGKYTPLFRDIEQLQRRGMFWMAYDKDILISERPQRVRINNDGVLHDPKGPALRYSDGWELYFWNGTQIPKFWITNPETLEPLTALTWENLEQRRVAVEILGWSRILTALKARVIDEDGDPLIGTLLEVQLPGLLVRSRFCKVKCGTGRDFAIGVPPHINTAMEAQAWMQGVTLQDFVKPEVRS